MECSGLTNLKKINFGYNQIKEIDPNALANLEAINSTHSLIKHSFFCSYLVEKNLLILKDFLNLL